MRTFLIGLLIVGLAAGGLCAEGNVSPAPELAAALKTLSVTLVRDSSDKPALGKFTFTCDNLPFMTVHRKYADGMVENTFLKLDQLDGPATEVVMTPVYIHPTYYHVLLYAAPVRWIHATIPPNLRGTKNRDKKGSYYRLPAQILSFADKKSAQEVADAFKEVIRLASPAPIPASDNKP